MKPTKVGKHPSSSCCISPFVIVGVMQSFMHPFYGWVQVDVVIVSSSNNQGIHALGIVDIEGVVLK